MTTSTSPAELDAMAEQFIVNTSASNARQLAAMGRKLRRWASSHPDEYAEFVCRLFGE